MVVYFSTRSSFVFCFILLCIAVFPYALIADNHPNRNSGVLDEMALIIPQHFWGLDLKSDHLINTMDGVHLENLSEKKNTIKSVHGFSKEFNEAVRWLDDKAHLMIRDSQRVTSSGIHAFPPQVGSGYEAFWLRDYEYMLEGRIESFTDKELRDACIFFVNGQRKDGAMVDCIKFDGTPIYMPGYGTMGENPVADGSQFCVGVAWHTWQKLKDDQLVKQIIDALVLGMKAIPINPQTQLVWINPDSEWDRCPYGFTDSVRKKGDLLFCSLLYVQASRQLSDLLEVADYSEEEVAFWKRKAKEVSQAIRTTLWNPEIGLFRGATVHCTQPDVWGSAFAVYLDVADDKQSMSIANYFEANYSGLVKRGQVRHTPSATYWDQACGQETYQNGAYWGTPVGWFVYTLSLVSPQLAEKTVLDMVEDFQENGVNECVNDNGYRNVQNYVDSAVLPLAGIKAMIEKREDQ